MGELAAGIFGYWQARDGLVETIGTSPPEELDAAEVGDDHALAITIDGKPTAFRLLSQSTLDEARSAAQREASKGATVVLGRPIGSLSDSDGTSRAVFATLDSFRPFAAAPKKFQLEDEGPARAIENTGTIAQDMRASIDQNVIAAARAFPLATYLDRSEVAGLPALPGYAAQLHGRDEFPIVVTPAPEGIRASLYVSLSGGGFFHKIRDQLGRDLGGLVGTRAISEVGQWAYENGITSVVLDGVLGAHDRETGESLGTHGMQQAMMDAALEGGVFGAAPEGVVFSFSVLDIPLLDAQDLHALPLEQRLRRMKSLRWLQSQGTPDPRESFMSAGHHRYVRNRAAFKAALEHAVSLRGSAGALARSAAQPYPLSMKPVREAGAFYPAGLAIAAKVHEHTEVLDAQRNNATAAVLTIPIGLAAFTGETLDHPTAGKVMMAGFFPLGTLAAKCQAIGSTVRLWATGAHLEESELGEVKALRFEGLRPIIVGSPRKPESLDKLMRRMKRRGNLRNPGNPYKMEWGERLVEREGYGDPGALAFAKRARILESRRGELTAEPQRLARELNGGQHVHALLRSEGKTADDGAHRHLFRLETDLVLDGVTFTEGTFLYTEEDGAHSHTMAERAEKTRTNGSSHRHRVTLPGGSVIETEEGGRHDHEAMVRLTSLDGGHRHVLRLGAKRLQSLGAGDLYDLAESPTTLFSRAPGPEMIEAAVRLCEEPRIDPTVVDDDGAIIPFAEGAADYVVLAHWLREDQHHEFLFRAPDGLAHGFDLRGRKTENPPVMTATQARLLLESPPPGSGFYWGVGYVADGASENAVTAEAREPKDITRMNLDGVVDVLGEQHVIVPADSGRLWFGRQDSELREFFVDGRKLRGRFTLERKGETFVAERLADQLPYVLSDKARVAGFVPPHGRSMLPEAVRKLIPAEFQYWTEVDFAARAAKLDAFREALESTGLASEMVERTFSSIPEDFFDPLAAPKAS